MEYVRIQNIAVTILTLQRFFVAIMKVHKLKVPISQYVVHKQLYFICQYKFISCALE